MSLLEIHGLTHSFGENLLYKNAELTLNKGEHIGIVGQNGTGKSTLVKICTDQVLPDAGEIIWQANTSIGYLDQYAEIDHSLTMRDFLKSAFSRLYQIEAEMALLYEKAANGDMGCLGRAAQLQECLETEDFYSIDTRIEQVASGLGLFAVGLDRTIDQMSGGQRAKVILAKLLLEKPDVLLLDEPTNFLDKEHVAWLADYLSELENAFMVVSHDFAFLDKIANRICDIDNYQIAKYYGTYSEFLKKKTLLREDYVRQYSAQQREIKKTEEFIRKNIAGRKSKMARGRQKQLDRMDKLEALDQKEITPILNFIQPPVPVRACADGPVAERCITHASLCICLGKIFYSDSLWKISQMAYVSAPGFEPIPVKVMKFLDRVQAHPCVFILPANDCPLFLEYLFLLCIVESHLDFLRIF